MNSTWTDRGCVWSSPRPWPRADVMREPPAAEPPTLDVTSVDGQDRAVHGIPAARRRPDGAVRGSSDAAERLFGDDRGPAAARVHAGIGRHADGAAGQRAVATRRVQGRSRGAPRGPLPLDAGGRRPRSVGPSRSRIDHGVRRRGGGGCRRRERVPATIPSAIAYLKEPQWTNGFGTALARETEVRRSIRVPAIVDPLTGGEAIVSAPAAGRFMAAALRSVGDRVQAGQELGRIQPRSSGEAADRATLGAAVAEAQASAEAARSDLARAERLLAERAVPARRVEEARRAADGRRSAPGRRHRPGWPSATRRCAPAAAPLPEIRSCCVRPSRAVSRKYLPRSARRTTKARRCSGSCEPTASSCRCTSRRPKRRLREPHRRDRAGDPGRARARRRGGRSHARCRRHRSRHACASRAVRRRQPGRRAAHRPDGDRDPLPRRASTNDDGTERRGPDGSGPAVRVRPARRRELRAAVHRDRRP